MSESPVLPIPPRLATSPKLCRHYYSLKHLRVISEVVYIEHLLRVVQLIFPLLLQLRIQPVRAPEVGDAARSRYARSGEDDDVPGGPEEVERLGYGGEVGETLAPAENTGEGELGE
jgi:hypothetical protein